MLGYENTCKILLVSPLPPPAGGIAIWTEKYLKWARDNNVYVEIVNTAVIGGRAVRINTNRNLADEFKRTIMILRDLKKQVKCSNPTVVHINSACGKFGIIRDYLCAIIVKKRGIPLIVHYRCNIEDQIKNGKIQKYFLRKIAKLANVNLVLNTPSKKYIDIESGQVSSIVPNFIDDEFIIKERKYINAKIEKIVFVGHVQISKGVKEIIEVARYFPDICFILAGPVSDELELLEVPKNVILKGSVNQREVKELLIDADAFLFPTYTEGFSNALLEAMAMGVPVITTNVGANADMIESYGGILVRSKNIEDIICAISKLGDKEYREKLSAWNVDKVKENYSINSVMKKLLSIYNHL